jgi:hypothetical protein
MMHADIRLARRLEAAEATNARGCNQGQPGGAMLDVAGGVAIFAGRESPLTQAIGLGLSGPVSQAEFDALEDFFRFRETRVSVELCPLASPELVQMLGERGYRLTEFNNVLVRPLGGELGTSPAGIRRAEPGEADLWSRIVGEGFFEQPDLTAEEMDVGRTIFNMYGAMCYLAFPPGGELAGGAAMALRDGVATMFADGVAARFRRQGLHGGLIAARLRDAASAGCDLATASTLPGSTSQRNYERAGFQVVYTKTTFVRNFI